MGTPKALTAISTLMLLVLLAGCAFNKTAENFRFLDSVDGGVITPAEEKGSPTGQPAFIMNGFKIGDDKRRALVVVAPARIVFDVGQVKNQSKLKFSVGMNATVGDGAEAIIEVEADGQTEVVYHRYLNPIDQPGDRLWHDESVELSKFSGKRIKMNFATRPGPKGDAMADWIAWADIKITS